MPVLTLPDGSTRSFDGPVTGATLAALMNGRNLHDAALEGLAAAALAVETDASAPDLTAAAFQTRLAEARRLNAP